MKEHNYQCQRTKPANVIKASNASEQRTKKCNQWKRTKTHMQTTPKKTNKGKPMLPRQIDGI